ncbi:N-acetyl-alpha-D-glucosaminyl L-malate synthase BshA [Caldithrix abyssi]|uniref:Glycosyl transferase group 1 n=1 Tax=Caldithrix abyssi DSM 13497 TaxID=880073 RepID=H1XRD1_CALAY|nr:N-acetyl-alpha-D-glucosaminyl L-malate synthase BshA [Caldithrix abyssi]APF18402.1 N-acetyl-alpha-D-glucosaminyl L-malate synthase BshA [Caldithrix abyssi DSM 13497]EHO42412.1 glycosyl transferase group 1 [Caldithrix abyssi DSM 13497]
MKIGITCYPTYGGSGVVATELGIYLARDGHEVHFISYAIPYRLNRFHKNLYFHEVEVVDYPVFQYPPYSLALASKIVEVAENVQLDIIHAHYVIPHATSACLARDILEDGSLKVITTLHGTDITLVGQHPSFKRTVQHSINKSDGVTSVSEYLAMETRQAFTITKDIHVIPNFIPTNFLELQDKPISIKKHTPDEPFIICHISNFRPLKRVKDIVLIVEQLVRRFPVLVYMVGDGPERSLVEYMVHEKNLKQYFTFLGKQDRVSDILLNSDLFLLPSESESFGLAALEAMACGVPCVTSDAGGLPEVNIDGKTGFIVPVGQIEQYVRQIQMLRFDPELREQFAINAKKIAFENFHPDNITPLYLNFYEQVLNRE